MFSSKFSNTVSKSSDNNFVLSDHLDLIEEAAEVRLEELELCKYMVSRSQGRKGWRHFAQLIKAAKRYIALRRSRNRYGVLVSHFRTFLKFDLASWFTKKDHQFLWSNGIDIYPMLRLLGIRPKCYELDIEEVMVSVFNWNFYQVIDNVDYDMDRLLWCNRDRIACNIRGDDKDIPFGVSCCSETENKVDSPFAALKYVMVPPAYVTANSIFGQVLNTMGVETHPLLNNILSNVEAVLLFVYSLPSCDSLTDICMELAKLFKMMHVSAQLAIDYVDISRVLLLLMKRRFFGSTRGVSDGEFISNPFVKAREWLENGPLVGEGPARWCMNIFTFLVSLTVLPKNLKNPNLMGFLDAMDRSKAMSAADSLLHVLGGAYQYLMFGDKSWMVTKDSFKLWYEKVVKLQKYVTNLTEIEEGKCEEYTSLREFEKDLYEAISQGDELLATANDYVRVTLKSHVYSSVRTQNQNLIRIHKLFRQYLCQSSIRACPYSLAIVGEPNIGKSSIVGIIDQQFCAKFGISRVASNRYPKPASDTRWDGYRGQQVILQNDIDKLNPTRPDAAKEALDMQNMCDNKPYVVPMADLPDKGVVLFRGELILTTTNSLPLKLDGIFTDVDAINRRFPLGIRVKLNVPKENGTVPKFDYTDKARLHEIYRFDIEKYRARTIYEVVEHDLTVSQMLQYVMKDAEVFRSRQEQVIKNYRLLEHSQLCPCGLLKELCMECGGPQFVETTRLCDCVGGCEICHLDAVQCCDTYFEGPDEGPKGVTSLDFFMGIHNKLSTRNFARSSWLFRDPHKPTLVETYLSFPRFLRTNVAKLILAKDDMALLDIVEKDFVAKCVDKFTVKNRRAFVYGFSKKDRVLANNYFVILDVCYTVLKGVMAVVLPLTLYKLLKKKPPPKHPIQGAEEVEFEEEEEQYVLRGEDEDTTGKAWLESDVPLLSMAQMSVTLDDYDVRVPKCMFKVKVRGNEDQNACAMHLKDGFFLTVAHLCHTPHICVFIKGKEFLADKYLLLKDSHEKDLCIFHCSGINMKIPDMFKYVIPTLPHVKFLNLRAYLYQGGEMDVTLMRKQLTSGTIMDRLRYRVAMSDEYQYCKQVCVFEGIAPDGTCGSPVLSVVGNHGAIIGVVFASALSTHQVYSVCLDQKLLGSAMSVLGGGVPRGVSTAVDPMYLYEGCPRILPLYEHSFINYCVNKPKLVLGSIEQYGQTQRSKVLRSIFFDIVDPLVPLEEKHTIPQFTSERGTRLYEGKQVNVHVYNGELMFGPKTQFNQQEITQAVLSVKKEYDIDVDNGPISWFDTINGWQGEPRLKMSTSFGFPHRGQKQQRMVKISDTEWEFVPQDMAIIERMDGNYRHGIRCAPVFIGSYKDEHISIKKNNMGGLRMFQGSSALMLVVMKKYFNPFVVAFKKAGLKAEHAIGQNSFGPFWTEMAKRFLNHGSRIIDGDFKKFDKKMQKEIVLAAFEIIIYFSARGGKFAPEDLLAMRTIAQDVAEYVCLMRGDLVVVEGNPSGQLLTTVINCLADALYFRMAWFHYYPRIEFSVGVCACFYGDDSVIAVRDGYEFSHSMIAQYFAAHGLEYTTAQKTGQSYEYSTVDKVDFLKRRFRAYSFRGEVIYLDPLGLLSVLNMLCWTRAGQLDEISRSYEALMNVEREIIRQDGENERIIRKVLDECWTLFEERYRLGGRKQFNLEDELAYYFYGEPRHDVQFSSDAFGMDGVDLD